MKAGIMAARTIVTIYDDLDNSEGASTVSFAYRGTSYEIDLGEKNQAAMDKALARFIAKARKKSGPAPAPRRRGRGSARAKGSTQLSVVRAWAEQNGFEASDRGRISSKVQAAYDAAH
jgi:hypothetical protein